jgi:hypothetical protein
MDAARELGPHARNGLKERFWIGRSAQAVEP